ncbi:MAG: UbiA family prenyltransferase [Bacteroidota bacterium]|nr:UbiA family prenyltransferase [Bacteroidota bacterium]MDP3146388.1 UbiA family prenyltransferase [Bacteroidota bacterium]
MKLLLSPIKKILDFIILSNIFISVCVAFFTLQTALIFPKYSEHILQFILPNFIATFVLYNIQRLYYAAILKDTIKYNWYNKNRRLIFTLIILAIFCSFNFLWNFFLENLQVLFLYIGLTFLSLFYFLPPFQLRNNGLLKPFIIAFVFIFTSVVLPLISEFDKSVFIYAIGQFCFISALCLLFDIRDVENDSVAKLVTLPIKLGIANTKYITIILVLIYLATAFLMSNTNFLITSIVIVSLSVLLTLMAKPNRHNYFYLFLVDGCIIIQSILIIFFEGRD